MKKIYLAILAILFMASNLWAAGSCTQTVEHMLNADLVVTLVCTGDSANGSIPTQTIDSGAIELLNLIYRMVDVRAYPTSGGTAPDAADIAIYQNGQDLLGGKGVNLIHATATYNTAPYSAFMSAYYYPLITAALTLTVANQATNSANYTIELIFSK
jgi:hypothetical protein